MVSGEVSTLWLSGMLSTSLSVAVSGSHASCVGSDSSFTVSSSEAAAAGASASAVTSLESSGDAELGSGRELGAAFCEFDEGGASLFFAAVVASTATAETGLTGAVEVTAGSSSREDATVMGVSVTSVEVVADDAISASGVGEEVGVTGVLLSSGATGGGVTSPPAALTDDVRGPLTEAAKDFSGSAVTSVGVGEADWIGAAVAVTLVAVSSSGGAAAVTGAALDSSTGVGGQQFNVSDCESSGVESV